MTRARRREILLAVATSVRKLGTDHTDVRDAGIACTS
jgi:hypothetical protein